MPRQKKLNNNTEEQRSFNEIKRCYAQLYIQSWGKSCPRDPVQVGHTMPMHCPLDTFQIYTRDEYSMAGTLIGRYTRAGISIPADFGQVWCRNLPIPQLGPIDLGEPGVCEHVPGAVPQITIPS